MKQYADIDNDSGVEAYEYTASSITIKFKGQAQYGSWPNIQYSNTYKYTSWSAGSNTIEIMKIKADEGEGLNRFINKYKPAYSSKWNS